MFIFIIFCINIFERISFEVTIWKIVFGSLKCLESFDIIQLYKINRVEDYYTIATSYYVNNNNILDQYLGKSKSIFMDPIDVISTHSFWINIMP